MKELHSLEIFSGAGGMAIGAHSAGIRCDALVDSSPSVRDTLLHNKALGVWPMAGAEIIHADVSLFDFHPWKGRVDMLLGGPPCQPFSQGGKRQHYNDKRNMFPQAVRALSEIEPKAFMFENVKGLTLGANRNYAELIRLQLKHPNEAMNLMSLPWEEQLSRLEDIETATSGAQYNVIVHTANAADYGVPQKRERVFFVGLRSDLFAHWHFPEPTHSQSSLVFDKSVSGSYWERHSVPERFRKYSIVDLEEGQPQLRPWLTVRDAIEGLPDPAGCDYSRAPVSQHVMIPGAREYRGHTGSSLDEPSKTLKAGVNGVPGGENMLRLSEGGVRYFTIRECARLQSFPDTFEFAGNRSEMVKQVGNAVPCLLSEIFARSLRSALDTLC